MTVPMEYVHASRDFDAFLEALRVRLDHTTRHQTYQTVEAVLRVFRRRLEVGQALLFADALPAVLRAIFVASWDIDEPRRPFGTPGEMNREVHEVRINHNLSPETAIEDMAEVLREFVVRPDFEGALDRLPGGARAFWRGSTEP